MRTMPPLCHARTPRLDREGCFQPVSTQHDLAHTLGVRCPSPGHGKHNARSPAASVPGHAAQAYPLSAHPPDGPDGPSPPGSDAPVFPLPRPVPHPRRLFHPVPSLSPACDPFPGPAPDSAPESGLYSFRDVFPDSFPALFLTPSWNPPNTFSLPRS